MKNLVDSTAPLWYGTVEKKQSTQRGDYSMTQTTLPFKYEIEPTDSKVTAHAGLPLYLELISSLGLDQHIDRFIAARKDSQGFTDSQLVIPLILLNLAGGDCVSDIDVLHDDHGLRRLIKKCVYYGKTRNERRELERRWRKQTERLFASQSSYFRYLSQFHDPQQEELRQPNQAFIPERTDPLKGIYQVNRVMVQAAQLKQPVSTATLDIDATLALSNNRHGL